MNPSDIKLNQRPIPEPALRDPFAVEMLRVWIAEKRLHCSLKVGMYAESTKIDEAQAWGTILADVARHLAEALHTGYAVEVQGSIEKISAQFLAELAKPTSRTEGEFVKRH